MSENTYTATEIKKAIDSILKGKRISHGVKAAYLNKKLERLEQEGKLLLLSEGGTFGEVINERVKLKGAKEFAELLKDKLK